MTVGNRQTKKPEAKRPQMKADGV